MSEAFQSYRSENIRYIGKYLNGLMKNDKNSYDSDFSCLWYDFVLHKYYGNFPLKEIKSFDDAYHFFLSTIATELIKLLKNFMLI